MKRLSIIIPAYNVKDYLNILIKSIYEPEIDKNMFEVIIVDDGSTDGTDLLCDELAEKYSNVIVIHQPNSGSPAGPRNMGVLRATGDYVFFADADDYFFPKAVAKIINYINNKDVDVALFKVDASDWGKDYYKGLFEFSRSNCKIFNSKILNSLGPYKLFKRKVIVDNNIRFPEKMAYEDLPFTLEAYFCAEKISIVADMPYYKYVKRTDGGSLSTSKETGGFFGSEAFNSRVRGIKYYLDTCSRLSEVKSCPQIYLRGVRYTDRLLSKLCEKSRIDELNELKDIVGKVYCDEIRALVSFSTLTRMDALIYGSIDLLKEVVKSWPDGPKTEFWYDDKRNENYYKCTFEQIKEQYLIQTIPKDKGWGRKEIEDPHITRNYITEAKLNESCIVFKGRMEFLRKLNIKDEKDITAKIRFATKAVSGICQSNVQIQNLIAKHCYASVWKYEFDWAVDVALKDFMSKLDVVKQQVAFYLNIKLGGTVIDDRFGHQRDEGVLTNFFTNAVLYKECVLAPTVTEYSNISLNIIPVTLIQNTEVNIQLLVNELESSIVVLGNQGFDNYPDTKVMAEVDGIYLFELQKGERRGKREFKGIIHVNQNNNFPHELKIKSRILGGELNYSNIAFSYSTNMREYETNSDNHKTYQVFCDKKKEPFIVKNGKSCSYIPSILLSIFKNDKD